jgi:uncharacterized protein
VNAFYFGPSERPLFGVYVPPRAGAGRADGVVLCPPFGWEYLRAHRAFRQLAARLADANWHVLRFDYSGTGDSAGEGWEASFEQWVADVGTAVDELKDTAGVQRVTLVGCRLGATLAACAAAGRSDIDRLVLWDPIVDGNEYVAELTRSHPRLGAATELSPALAGAAGALDVGAFPVPQRMSESLQAIDLLDLPGLRVRSTFTVASEPTPQSERLSSAFSACGIESNWRYLPSAANGTKADDFVNTVLPTEVLDAIVQYLGGAAR